MGTLPQQALDISVGVINNITGGAGISDRAVHVQLATAIQLLAQNALGTLPSVDAPPANETTTDVSTTTATQVSQ